MTVSKEIFVFVWQQLLLRSNLMSHVAVTFSVVITQWLAGNYIPCCTSYYSFYRFSLWLNLCGCKVRSVLIQKFFYFRQHPCVISTGFLLSVIASINVNFAWIMKLCPSGAKWQHAQMHSDQAHLMYDYPGECYFMFRFCLLVLFSVAFEVHVMIDFERFLVCVTFKRWSSCDLIKTHCFFYCKIDCIYYSLSFELFSVPFCSKSISSYQFMEAFCLLRRYYWVIFKYLRQLCVCF